MGFENIKSRAVGHQPNSVNNGLISLVGVYAATHLSNAVLMPDVSGPNACQSKDANNPGGQKSESARFRNRTQADWLRGIDPLTECKPHLARRGPEHIESFPIVECCGEGKKRLGIYCEILAVSRKRERKNEKRGTKGETLDIVGDTVDFD